MIQVENLSKTYKTLSTKKEALKNVSFSVKEKEVLGILGMNGAGKSTLIKILSTVLNRDSGLIRMAGYSIEDIMNYKKTFTVALQNSSLESWLSVEENLKIYGKFFGLNKSILQNKTEEVIGLFQLDEFRKKRASELSGGYKKRLQLARSFLVDTPVMMFDEPTAGLDPIAKNQVIKTLKEKAAEGKSIIFTTQIIPEAEALCDKLLILKDGITISNGKISDIKSIFNLKNTVEFKFNKVTESIYNEAVFICKRKENLRPKIDGDSILFNLSMYDNMDKKLINELFEKLTPIYLGIKEPTLEEVFIELVKEK